MWPRCHPPNDTIKSSILLTKNVPTTGLEKTCDWRVVKHSGACGLAGSKCVALVSDEPIVKEKRGKKKHYGRSTVRIYVQGTGWYQRSATDAKSEGRFIGTHVTILCERDSSCCDCRKIVGNVFLITLFEARCLSHFALFQLRTMGLNQVVEHRTILPKQCICAIDICWWTTWFSF